MLTEVTDSAWSSWLVLVEDHGIMTMCCLLIGDSDPDAEWCWLPSYYSTQKPKSLTPVSLFGGLLALYYSSDFSVGTGSDYDYPKTPYLV